MPSFGILAAAGIQSSQLPRLNNQGSIINNLFRKRRKFSSANKVKQLLLNVRFIFISLKISMLGPGRVGQWVGALSHTPKGCGFDSWSGHILRLQVRSAVGVQMGGNR